MSSVKDEIRSAAEKLSLPRADFRKLPDSEAEVIYWKALRHFVREGEPRWWWEHFSSGIGVDFPAGDGWRHIPDLVPNSNEHVWFIVEDDLCPFYPVYDATADAICAVIAECYGFEYYIVHPQLDWLICETHHNRIVAVGKVVEEKLRKYTS